MSGEGRSRAAGRMWMQGPGSLARAGRQAVAAAKRRARQRRRRGNVSELAALLTRVFLLSLPCPFRLPVPPRTTAPR